MFDRRGSQLRLQVCAANCQEELSWRTPNGERHVPRKKCGEATTRFPKKLSSFVHTVEK